MEILSQRLTTYLDKQLYFFFPDGESAKPYLQEAVSVSLKQLKECFGYINNKYYVGEFSKTFNNFNGDHYSMFLYKVSHNVFSLTGDELLASKIFNLNKALHGIDAFYKIKLPSIFLFVHPLGTVLGNAKYSDFFCVYQGCTVGSKDLGIYPVFNGRTILYSNSTVLGASEIGNNTIMGSGAMIIDQKITDNLLVLGSRPNQKQKNVDLKYFDVIFKH